MAELANISTVYYERLERGRGALPSAAVLAGLAQALRLTDPERDYLHRLAGHSTPPRPQPSIGLDPGLDYLLHALENTAPASITDELNDVLAQNRLNCELLGNVVGRPGWGANLTWLWFTQPAWRDQLEPAGQHAQTGLAYVADLRAAVSLQIARAPALLADLLAVSDEFAGLWQQHVVMTKHCATKRVVHPAVGAVELECSVVTSPASTQRLLVLQPVPGTPSAERLAQLGNLVQAGRG